MGVGGCGASGGTVIVLTFGTMNIEVRLVYIMSGISGPGARKVFLSILWCGISLCHHTSNSLHFPEVAVDSTSLTEQHRHTQLFNT